LDWHLPAAGCEKFGAGMAGAVVHESTNSCLPVPTGYSTTPAKVIALSIGSGLNGPEPKNDCGISYFGILERRHNTILSDLASSEHLMGLGCGVQDLCDHSSASPKCIAIVTTNSRHRRTTKHLQRTLLVLVASIASRSPYDVWSRGRKRLQLY